MAASTIVLITGANSGVGYACSKALAQTSADYHVIMASRNKQNGEKAVTEIQALPGIKGTISTVQLDVTDQQSLDRAAKEVEEKFGRVDVLVNNAGIGELPDSFIFAVP